MKHPLIEWLKSAILFLLVVGCASQADDGKDNLVKFYENGFVKTTSRQLKNGEYRINCLYWPNGLVSEYVALKNDSVLYKAVYAENGECLDVSGTWGRFFGNIVKNENDSQRLSFMIFPRQGFQKIVVLEDTRFNLITSLMHLDQRKIFYDTVVRCDLENVDTLRAVFGHRDTTTGETIGYNYIIPSTERSTSK